MSNLTTTRHACGIGVGDVILTNPWTLRPGRWTALGVAVVNEDYTAIRVDDCDLEWVLPDTLDVAVEITAREAMVRAVEVLSLLLTDDDYDGLPLVGWHIDEDTGRLFASLHGDKAVATVHMWAEALKAEVGETERPGSQTIALSTVLDGVPIRMSTTIYTETPAAVTG